VRRALPALAIVLLLAGCGGGGGKSAQTTTVERTVTAPATTTTAATTTTTSTPSVTTHGRFHYPDAVIENYMKSCVASDSSKEAYCGCTLDKLSNNVSVQDFARVGLAGGKLPPRIQRLIRQAAVACVDKL
jgi:hypothetical protein